MTDKEKELLSKIKKLAETGADGEKANAELMLKKIMKKYNISSEELSEIELFFYDFKINKKIPMHENIVIQIIFNHFTTNDVNWWRFYKPHVKNKICIKCTKLDYIELHAKIDFYSKSYEKQLKTFFTAFVHKYKLFRYSNDDVKEMSFEERMKLRNIMDGLENESFKKQIEYSRN